MEDQEIQEIKKKKQSLKRYRNNLSCIRRLENKIKSGDARINSIRSPRYSDMPKGGTPITTEELIADKIDLEKRIKRLKAKGATLKSQILEEIDSLEDYRYCEVLEAYFIDCKSIADIAEDMGYTDRYVYDLYKDAIYQLTFSITTLNVQ